MSDLIDCQNTVERMLTDGRTVAEVEEYVDRYARDEMEKGDGEQRRTAPGVRPNSWTLAE